MIIFRLFAMIFNSYQRIGVKPLLNTEHNTKKREKLADSGGFLQEIVINDYARKCFQ